MVTTKKKSSPATAKPKAGGAKKCGLTIDSKAVIQQLETFLSDYLKTSGFSGYIIGLTGGLDTAVSASIAVRAVGAENVTALCMPHKTSLHTVKDARTVAKWLGINMTEIDITKIVNSYYMDTKSMNPLRVGNKMARERMAILFDQAFDSRQLVLGVKNRSEIALGYFTWFGDSGCSVDLLGQLYKTQVLQIARELQVPQSILDKPPSADLWPGQTDEDELGLTYADVDRFLCLVVDQGITSRAAILKEGFADEFIDRTLALVNRYTFKRKCPIIPNLGMSDFPDIISLNK